MKHPSHKQVVKIGDLCLAYYSFKDFNASVSKAIETISHDDEAPLYGTLWPSAHLLLESLSAIELKGKRVLEIGCGLGIPSIFCALKGASVIASDYHPDSAAYVKANSELNQCRVDFLQLDWRNKHALPDTDYIIGSDILYEPNHYAALASFLAEHVSRYCQVIISDPKRIYSHLFVAELEKKQLSVDTREENGMCVHWIKA